MTRATFAAGLFASMTCFCLQAETMDMKAKIPFDFRVGDVEMPAGDYLIRHSPTLVTVRNDSGRSVSATFLALPASRSTARTHGVLEFNRYEDAYFLGKVWIPDSRTGSTLPTGAREKERLSRGRAVQTTVIALQRN